MTFEILDIGNGVIEITTKFEGTIVSQRLMRKESFREVEFQPTWEYVSIEGVNNFKLKFAEVTKIGTVAANVDPTTDQILYDELKAIMIT